jgi:hypothetical protein
MNLYRAGHTVLNMDRVNGILDHQTPADPNAPAGQTVLRILFDHRQIELAGQEAWAFRNWYRVVSRNLSPHRDEHGRELVSPEDQVRRTVEDLVHRIDKDPTRSTAVVHAARHLKSLVTEFISGDLQPKNIRDFEKSLDEGHGNG